MILKYKVPLHERKRYNNKKILYCEVITKLKLALNEKKYVYKVKLLNGPKRIDIFLSDELKNINLFDKLKLLFFKK